MNCFYVSDLDGTLLHSDASLSDFSEAALREMLAEGLLFTVASARSVISMQGVLRGLPLRLPVIEFNGAFLSDLATGRHETINALSPSITEDVYARVLRHNMIPFVSSFDGTEDRVHYAAATNAGMHWYLEDRRRHCDRRWQGVAEDLTASLREQVVCLTVVAEEQPLAQLQAAVLQAHGDAVETHLFENLYSPGWYWLTVHDCRATKDQAIRLLAQRYGLTGSEIVVFGDQSNDIKMFQTADRAVAVSNATEELKRHASVIIGSNETDSVAKFIQLDNPRENRVY